MQQPMQNPEDISDPTTALDMALELMSKAFQLNNITLTNNNQRSSSNPCYSQIAQSGMNIDQDRQMLMVDDNVGNQFRENAVENVGHLVGQNAVQNQAPAEGNGNGINGTMLLLQQQLQIAQEEEAGIQSTQKEFDCMASAGACEETERANANYTLENNLQQASTSGTLSDKAPVYDSDGSAENDSNVISEVSGVEQGGGTIEQHPATVEETPKFVRDFKSLTKEAGKSIVKQKALELEIEHFLREVVSRDIMSIVQNPSAVDTSNLQTDLKQMVKKCKYDKNLNDQAYNNMQQRIERLQAQLGYQKGKSKDTPCVSDTLDPLS
ncbi:hypothetical protein Tco_1314783 [Tanacetum coccineum]